MQGFRWFAARAKEIVVNTPSRSVEQSVERSTKIAKVLARRMRVAQDRFNERLTSAAKHLSPSPPAACFDPWSLWSACSPRACGT